MKRIMLVAALMVGGVVASLATPEAAEARPRGYYNYGRSNVRVYSNRGYYNAPRASYYRGGYYGAPYTRGGYYGSPYYRSYPYGYGGYGGGYGYGNRGGVYIGGGRGGVSFGW